MTDRDGLGIEPHHQTVSPRFVRTNPLGIVFLIGLATQGPARADELACSDPTVAARIEQKAGVEFERSLRSDRAELLPLGQYKFTLSSTREDQHRGPYIVCRGTLAIDVPGGQQASTDIGFDLQDGGGHRNSVFWDYAPFQMMNLVNNLKQSTRAAVAQNASKAAQQAYQDARAKGLPFCPAWLSEQDKRERADRAASSLADDFRNPMDPQEALQDARSSLTSWLGAYGEHANDLKRMTEADFVSCIPAVGKLLIENDRRKTEDVQQREMADQPAGRLLETYKNYIAVKRCAESRSAYEVRYIQDSELDEAKQLSKSIEQRLTNADPNIDKEKVWAEAEANPATRGHDIDRNVSAFMRMAALAAVDSNAFTEAGQSYCRTSLDALRNTRDTLDPDAHKTRKDF